ncbi:MAG: DUF4202 domain-containing protein [Rhizobiales bacterium]|nr:DUF4202 domain-containing protein [Hyphomicrobiales bacterium]
MKTRLNQVFTAIDAANASDPVPQRALLYGRRMSEVLERFQPDACELLRIAARAQHIERWILARESYPDGRVAYLQWRKDLQQHHAKRTGELMREAGYREDEIARVSSLLRKERLKYDADMQTLEDVICLVFLEFEAPEFIAKHPDDKVRDILAKTAKKMSARGIEEAGKLRLEPRLARLLKLVLSTAPKQVEADGIAISLAVVTHSTRSTAATG